MARRPRIDFAGYHHTINRGVNRSVVFENRQIDGSGDYQLPKASPAILKPL